MDTNEVAIIDKKNLTISYDKSKLSRIDSEIAGYLTPDEVHKVLSCISNKTHFLLADFLWKTGCRITEAISIRKRDIDFYNRTVSIRWLKGRKQRQRLIPMHQTLAYALSVYCGSMNLDDVVFQMSRQRAWQIVRKYGNQASIGKELHPHTFRHSFAIYFLGKVGNLIMLKDLLGHANITTTMVYLKYVQADKAEKINGLDF